MFDNQCIADNDIGDIKIIYSYESGWTECRLGVDKAEYQ